MQLKIVEPGERWQFSRALLEMHHHRKQIFVDRLGWDLPLKKSWLEIDEFDNDYAVYIMVVSDDGSNHLGSVRLLPTTGPHMLGSLFSDLCPEGAPAGPDVWEITRLVATPDRADGCNVLRIHRLLAYGIIQFARLNGIERYTLVAESQRMAALLSIGWRVLPLSLPTEHDGTMIEAAEILVERDSLERLSGRVSQLETLSSLLAMRTAA